jgi:hypothetical protein
MTEHNGHMTEGTNMMVDYLANSEKLKPKDQRWYPENNYGNNDDDMDDNFNNYVTHNDIPMNQNTETNNNGGDSYQQQNTYDERSEQNNQTVQGGSGQSNGSMNKFIDEEYEMLSALEKRLRRLDIMRALGELRDLGCKVTNYNIDDDYYMMKYELDLHRSIRSKRNWLGLYSHMLIGVVKGAELLNNNYNPFDFKLNGLSDEVSADKNTYYEILAEIYEFHNVPGKKMNPWFRLMVSLIGVVVVVGGKNNAHKFMPNRSKKVENDEDYIEKLRARAAKDSQSKESQQNNNKPKNNLDDYMNKQHEHAVQRAKDLEDLKKQELEYQRYQQMLAQQKDKFNDIKKNLELTASPSARSASSSKKDSARSLKSGSKSASSKSQKQKEPSDTMSEMSTSTHATNTTNATSQSGVSQISINNNLAKRLNSQLNNKSRKSTDISMDQISFGSNKRK